MFNFNDELIVFIEKDNVENYCFFLEKNILIKKNEFYIFNQIFI